ncbi:hypothetical protein B566_EDAN010801 [Ephemera danica]|nr:hypothetical protein B566_EDAN010801 [Ephemera danica]
MRSTPPGQPNPEPRPLPASKAGSEMADRVASLVTNGLGETTKKQQQGKPKPQQKQQQSGGGGLFGGFMRLLGLDSTRLGAIAINAFVYVSELIAATLTRMNPPGPAETRSDFKKPSGTPFSWLLDNPGPKLSPVLWGMQRAVAETISPAEPAFKEDIPSTPTAVIWRHLPSRDELRQQGEQCETRFPECELPQPGDI